MNRLEIAISEKPTRREFMAAATGLAAAPAPVACAVLQPFDYEGIRLLDGPLKEQFEYARNFYFNIPDDNLLRAFRLRAGLPAPGSNLVG